MKFIGTVISVADINRAKKFYEDLFDLEIYQDYGINICFTCGLALQQNFDWLVNISKNKIIKQSNNMELCFEEIDFDGFLNRLRGYPNIVFLGNVIEHSWGQRVIRFYDLDDHLIEVGESMEVVINRFLDSGMNIEEVANKLDISVQNLNKLLKK